MEFLIPKESSTERVARFLSALPRWVLKVGCPLEALPPGKDPTPDKAIAHSFYYPQFSFPFTARSDLTKQSIVPAVPDLENRKHIPQHAANSSQLKEAL